ncbi:MAG: hypothetical protein WC959_00425 [Kiritimatiellales bacterium]
MKNKLSIIMSIVALIMTGSTAWGVLAVDFGGDYGSSDVDASKSASILESDKDFNFDGNNTDRRRYQPIDRDFLVLPALANKNNVLYGGYQIAAFSATVNPGNVNYYRYLGAQKTLQISSAGSTTNMGLAFTPYVKKADFLNGQAGVANLSFDNAANSVSFTINLFNGTFAEGQTARALVQNGSTWYVSASEVTSATSLSFNGYTETWYAFDPSVNYFINTTNLGTGISGATLTDVQAFGVFMQGLGFDSTAQNNAAHFRITGFQASLVPEPGTIGLYIIGVVSAFFIRNK